MSFSAVAWAWGQSPGSPAAKFLLLVLADWADVNGAAWPTIQDLAARTEVKAAEIPDHLAALEEKRLIAVTPFRAAARKTVVVLHDEIARAYARSLGM